MTLISENDPPLLSLGRESHNESENAPTLAFLSPAFERLTRQEKARFLSEAEATIRFMHRDIADEVSHAAAREEARRRLTVGEELRGAFAELTVLKALPSYQAYFDAICAGQAFLTHLEEELDEEIDPAEYEGFGMLEDAMIYLLRLARDEASAIGIDLDAMMRGWFRSCRYPHGSPTAGTRS